MAQKKNLLWFHSCVVVAQLYTVFYDFYYLTWKDRPLLERCIKLTLFNFALSTVYWVARAVEDVVELPRWVDTRRVLLGLVMPLSTVVFLLFWAIVLYDADLLRNEQLKLKMQMGLVKVPMWLTHSYHTTVVLFPLVDLFLTRDLATSKHKHRKQQTSTATAISLFCVITGGYYATILSIGYTQGVWAYPLLAILSTNQRLLLGVLVMTLGSCLSMAYMSIDRAKRSDPKDKSR